jgi:hypothetical protein
VSLRADVVAAARQMHRLGLVAATHGNVSAREGDLVHITPTALPYEGMSEADLVTLSLTGQVVDGEREPSSERRVHLAVYAARPDVAAIVHTHSVYATAGAFGESSSTRARRSSRRPREDPCVRRPRLPRARAPSRGPRSRRSPTAAPRSSPVTASWGWAPRPRGRLPSAPSSSARPSSRGSFQEPRGASGGWGGPRPARAIAATGCARPRWRGPRGARWGRRPRAGRSLR